MVLKVVTMLVGFDVPLKETGAFFIQLLVAWNATMLLASTLTGLLKQPRNSTGFSRCNAARHDSGPSTRAGTWASRATTIPATSTQLSSACLRFHRLLIRFFIARWRRWISRTTTRFNMLCETGSSILCVGRWR